MFFNFYKYNKYQNELWKSPTLIGKKAEQVIPVGINDQSQQKEKPYHLSIFHELVIWFSSTDHFIQQKHHVTPI